MSASTGSVATTTPASGSANVSNTAAGTSGVAPGIGASGGTSVSGQKIGDKVKGGLGVIHGAGEALRGGINKFLDDAGEGIAGRSGGTTTATTTAGTTSTSETPFKRGDGGVSSADVANNGVNEVQRGMDALRR